MLSNYTVEPMGTKQVRILTPGKKRKKQQQQGDSNAALHADGHKLSPCIIFRWKAVLMGITIMPLDSSRCHIPDRVKGKLEAYHTDLVVIPGEMTCDIQSLKVCLNKLTKDRIHAAHND